MTQASPFLAILEALLFASENPISLADFVRILSDENTMPSSGVPEAEIKAALETLQGTYTADENRGFYLAEVAGGYQLRTKPEFSLYLQRLHKEKPHRLSRSSMETLSVIAYQQPVPRSVIEEVRGVDSSSAFRTLLDRSLIRVIGRSDEVGHPVLYGTTPYFLEVFNLKDLEALPPLESLETLRQNLQGEGTDSLAGQPAESEGEQDINAYAAVTDPEHFLEEAEEDKTLIEALESELDQLAAVHHQVVSSVFAPESGEKTSG